METINAVKRQPPFKRMDIVLYVLLCLSVAALFYVFVFSAPQMPLTAIEVWTEERGAESVCILTFDVASNKISIDSAWQDRIFISAMNNGWQVRITELNGREGYNILEMTANTVRITDANCSGRKDCTHFHPITHGEQDIICVPHGLHIVGIGEDALRETIHDDEIDILLG